MESSYYIQAKGLVEGGVDLLCVETCQDVLQTKAALAGIFKYFSEARKKLPVIASVTIETMGTMLLGTEISAALTSLEVYDVDVIGMNCATGPKEMSENVRYLCQNSPKPVFVMPNAGIPENVGGHAHYKLSPDELVHYLSHFVKDLGVNIVGGCCGTTKEHIKRLVDAVGFLSPKERAWEFTPSCSSLYQSAPLHIDPPPVLIGERTNANGSKLFRDLLAKEDWEGMVAMGKEQVREGAHILDVCTAYVGRDESRDMKEFIARLNTQVTIPLMIDSTEPPVIEEALQRIAGKAIVNSINMEDGEERMEKVLPLCKMYGAAVVALTIDEQGMAKTAQRKLEIARRIHHLATSKYDIKEQDLIFDALTFTLGSGDEEFRKAGIETIEAIKLIKQEFPKVHTSLGVSNISFGLAPHARHVLNSVFLHYAIEYGLDMAIVNPAHITAYPDISAEEKELAEDLIFNRRADALQRYIEYYEKLGPQAEASDAADPVRDMTPEQRLHWCIVHRHKEGVEADIDTIVNRGDFPTRHEAAVDTLNNVLLPAMKEVGDKFGAGELILPFVLQSAEVMKKTVAHLENYLEKKEGVSKGLVVLATVYGDVHDIGKNLVKTILANNGYEVIDLGKQVPAETIISRAAEVNATAIGLSALLVSTSKQMPLIVNELHRRNLQLPVLVGGAAINRRFGRRILYTEDGAIHEPGVFYCKDAFEGLETMDQLIVPEKRKELLARVRKEADLEMGRASQVPAHRKSEARSSVQPEAINHPLKWGQRIVKEMPLEIVLKNLNLNELYRLSWGAKNSHGAEWEKLQAEFGARLENRVEGLWDGRPWIFTNPVTIE